MSYGNHKLYLYEDAIDLVITTEGIYTDNRPMNNKDLKAHKGLTNDLVFNIRDRDRKLQNVSSDQLYGYLIDPTTKRRILKKLMEHTSNVGQVKLVLNDGDLKDVKPGLHTIYIARTTADSIDRPVFANQNSDIQFQIEITEQIDQTPIPTQTANTFTQVAATPSDAANIFTTSAFFGNQDRNFTSGLHSIAIHPTTYTGNIDIQASCVATSPDSDDVSTDWFTIDANIALTASSDIFYKSYTLNANWLRVLHKPDPSNSGTIDLIQVRN